MGIIKYIVCFVFCIGWGSAAWSADAVEGKKLYDQVCAYCHKTNFDDKFGPGLAGISERRSAEWLSKFLLNPAEMIRSDEYAQSLKENNEYNMTMPALPQMKDDVARDNVVAYLGSLKE